MVASKARSDMLTFGIKAVIGLVVIVVGIVVGTSIAVNTGLTERLNGPEPELLDLPNETALNVGSPLPMITVWDSLDRPLRLDEITADHATLVAFVSAGCDPCLWLGKRLEELKAEGGLPIEVILISHDPTRFREQLTLPVFRIDTEATDQMQVTTMPSIAVLNPIGEIQEVYSGYTRDHLDRILRRLSQD